MMLDRIKQEFRRKGKLLAYAQPGDTGADERIRSNAYAEFRSFWANFGVSENETEAARSIAVFVKDCGKKLVDLPFVRPDTPARGKLLHHEERAMALARVASVTFEALRDSKQEWPAKNRQGILARLDTVRRFLGKSPNASECTRQFIRAIETISRQF